MYEQRQVHRSGDLFDESALLVQATISGTDNRGMHSRH